MKGIPLAYNKDMQEDKRVIFLMQLIQLKDASFYLQVRLISNDILTKILWVKAIKNGFTNATDVA